MHDVRPARLAATTFLILFLAVACSGPNGSSNTVSGPAEGVQTAAEKPPQQGDSQPSDTESGPLHVSSLGAKGGVLDKWTGDLDGMVERDVIRALVVYSLTGYFLDGPTQRGITYEALKEFEIFLNKELGRRTLQVHVVIIPVRRDELLPALARGLGDIAAANLTITPERQKTVAFSAPFATGVNELIVTAPGSPVLTSKDQLSGMEIHARRSSSYWGSLKSLNADLADRGLAPVKLVAAEEFHEDEDLVEMVNAGHIPAIVMDSHKATFWSEIFKDVVIQETIPIRTGGQIGWAFRKDSPQIEAMVNSFVKGHKQGTLFGNVLLKRYFQANEWVKNNLAGTDLARFEATVEHFVRYGDQYDYDHLLLAALAYQESGLDQSKKSRAGAVGVMQMLPSTAADPNVGIRDINDLENNIHAGTKYLRFIHDRYFNDPDILPTDQAFFTFAAYNAGPARIRQLRSEAAAEGFDPNRWFGNVEVVAARRIGRETVQYVSNITKYYIAYRQAFSQMEQKQQD